jgi:preprotein translocase subunit SecA
VEYQREGFDMFAAMMDGIKEESVGFLFNLEVQTEPAPAPAAQPIANWTGDGAEGGVDVEPVIEAPLEPVGNGHGNGAGSGNGANLAKGLAQPNRPARLQYSAPAVDGDAHGAAVTADGPPATDLGDGVLDVTGGEPSRNAPCPCGSGRKYKRCHGDPARRSN